MNRYTQVANLSDSILMWIFAAVCIGAAFMSLFLWFHWSRYSMKDPTISFAQILYFLGLFLLILIALVLIL